MKNIGKAIARGTESDGTNGYMVDIVLSSDGLIPMSFAVYSPNFHEDVLGTKGKSKHEQATSLKRGPPCHCRKHYRFWHI